jgi:hypothetical protein
MNFAGFQLQRAKCEGSGVQIYSLLDARGQEPKVMVESTCIFEPTAYGLAANDPRTSLCRVTLSLALNESITALVEDIEGFLLQEAQHLQLFGGIGADELKSRFQGAIKTPANYEPYLWVKMNLAGGRSVQIWDSEGQPRDAPVRWKGCQLKINLAVRGIWHNNTSWGGLLEVTDCQVAAEESPACPFQA